MCFFKFLMDRKCNVRLLQILLTALFPYLQLQELSLNDEGADERSGSSLRTSSCLPQQLKRT